MQRAESKVSSINIQDGSSSSLRKLIVRVGVADIIR